MDLTGLKNSLNRMNAAQQQRHENETGTGERVIDLEVDKIIADPDQPRKEFDDSSIQELADDIKRHGLIQPIIVRKNAVGQYVVITGERRLRAYQKLKEPLIKAIVREYSADLLGYIQVAENLKRADLKFYELAEFINAKVQAGEKQVVIADKLGISKTEVSRYLSFFEAPDFLKEAKEKFSSIRAFSELVNLSKDYKEQVEEFLLDSDERISRAQVEAFKKSLTTPEPALPANDTGADNSGEAASTSSEDDGESSFEESGENAGNTGDDFGRSAESEDAGFDESTGDGADVESSSGDFSEADDSSFSDDDAEGETGTEDADEEASDSSSNEEGFAGELDESSDKLKKPLIFGSVEGREATLLFKKRPSTDGMIWVKYEDGFEEEILAERYRINRITEE